VAIKVLPAELSADEDRLKRFEREARSASSLNHPNIVTVYDIGSAEGASYIAMELVDGKTLREILAGGPVPARKLLGIAAQIAEGLAKAHSVGIVHRDLKPENVMVTKDGLVKILDFGLAKLAHPEVEAGHSTEAPTVTQGTEPGIVMGTVAYMSPEQASGHPVDYRSDQFSLGSVLYEMATGKRAFAGETKPEILASIIREEPEPIGPLAPRTPAPLRWIIDRCLAKEARERYVSTEDLARDLEGVRTRLSETSGSGEALGIRPPRRGLRTAALVLVGAILGAVALGLAFGLLRGRLGSNALRRLEASLNPPAGTSFALEDGGVSLSPDGRYLAFATQDSRLWVHDLSQSNAREIAGAAPAHSPFWSPDSRSVAFFSKGKLRVAELSGGSIRTVCDVSGARGGAWSPEGVILFARTAKGPLFRVPAAGGEPVEATVLEPTRREVSHRFPIFLPDGRHFLYVAWHLGEGPENVPWIVAGSLDSKAVKPLFRSLTSPVYAPSGHLLYVPRGRTLVAQRFDLRDLKVVGPAIPIVDQIEVSDWRNSPVTVSPSGLLVHYSGVLAQTRLVWFDRAGREIGTLGSPAAFEESRLSPDGTKVAVSVTSPQTGEQHVWIYDASRGTGAPGIAESEDERQLIWSPDGREICFSSYRDGDANLYVAPSDGTAPAKPLLQSERNKQPLDWSPDGKWIVYGDLNEKTLADIWLLPLFGERRPTPFIQTASIEYNARFSPDGRWLAYQSNQSGQHEVYVTPFPGPGERTQVSTGGGESPKWSKKGSEIVYLAGRQLMSVEIRGGPPSRLGAPRLLFEMPAGVQEFDVSPDSQKFLAIVPDKDFKPPPLTMVMNWTVGLEK
jgi:Tol biopolymer transport system component